MKIVVIFSILAIAQAAIPTKDTCKIGQKWATNHIVFECYKSAKVHKGVKPIACSIDESSLSAKLLKPSETHQAKNFIFECIETGDKMIYRPIKCIANDGHVMSPGQSYKAQAFTWTCEKNGEKGVKLSYKGDKLESVRVPTTEYRPIEKMKKEEDSCELNGTNIAVGKKHVVPSKFNDEWLTGTIFLCKKAGSGYKLVPYGCMVDNRHFKKQIRVGTNGRMNYQWYGCNVENGNAKLTLLDKTCTYMGADYKVGHNFIDLENNVTLRCSHDAKTGQYYVRFWECALLIDHQVIRIKHRKSYYNKKYGETYTCMRGHGTKGTVRVLTGCTYNDKKYKIGQTWDDPSNNAHLKCSIVRGMAKVIFNGCLYKLPSGKYQKIERNAVFKDANNFLLCKSKRLVGLVVKLTDAQSRCGEHTLFSTWILDNVRRQCTWAKRGRHYGAVEKKTDCIVPADSPTDYKNRVFAYKETRKMNETHEYECCGSKHDLKICLNQVAKAYKKSNKKELDQVKSGSMDAHGGEGKGEYDPLKTTTGAPPAQFAPVTLSAGAKNEDLCHGCVCDCVNQK